MAKHSHFYIPPRLYSLLKCIYKDRITVVAAPEGYGKSGTVREFVRRSRPEGISCRFIKDAENANDCFGAVCRIFLGHEEPIPTTASDYNRLCRLFVEAKPDKEILIVLDCPAATDMLLGNLYCMWLFTRYSPIHLTLITNELCYFHRMLLDSCFILTITEADLALTLAEASELFRNFGTDDTDIENIHRNTHGQLAKLRLSQILIKRGEPITSFELVDLIDNAMLKVLDNQKLFAAMCAAAIDKIDDWRLEILHSEPALVEYFGKDTISAEAIFSGIRYLRSMLPVVSLNERSRSWKSHVFFKHAANRAFQRLPQEISLKLHLCTAKGYLHEDKTFRAFCQFYLAGDLISAAEVPSNEKVSFDMLMRSKDFLLDFAEKCPLDCKPIIPRLLRILALLMLTPYRERINYRFDDVIAHISRSSAYARKERRDLLCYAHAVRTYENFYFIEKMGNNIKRAYEMYSGRTIGTPPFYTWAVYVPSVFCLIHRYELPISTEAEQFSRYHSMYTEMIHHGEFVVNLYNAEICYYTGDLENALIRARDVVEKCASGIYLPTRIAALNLIGKSSLLLGHYDAFMNAVHEIADIAKRFSTTELSEMASLCLARLCCMRKGTDEDIWEVTSKSDQEVLLNRHTAPFYFYIRCYAMLSHKGYRMLLSKIEYYIQTAEDVRNETMALIYRMTEASALLSLGEEERVPEIMTEVIRTFDGSGVVMPAAEICVLYPKLFEFSLKTLPKEHQRFLKRVLVLGKQFRHGMESVRTRELTELGTTDIHTPHAADTIDRLLSEMEEQRRELSLTRSAMRYALCAAHGYSNESIAEICGVSVDSVKSSLKRTFAKLGIRSRGQLKYIFDIKQ